MKFEVFKKNNLKRNIVIGGCVVLIISAIILNFSSARYRSTASVPIVGSEVNYVRPDINAVAIVVDGVSTNTMPEGNYKLLDTSYCTANGEDANVTLSWDQTAQALSVTPFTTRGTKCYLYFETSTTKTVNTALGEIEVNLDTPDFSKTSCSSGCGETTVGIYEGEDSDGATYYYRGDVENNYVSFAGFYWRIIRVNGDGSIRLIYQGTSATATGDNATIGGSAFNRSYNRSEYVGLKYTQDSQYGTNENSTIYTALNTWYEENINIEDEEYTNYIDTNAGFCGDRDLQFGTWSSTGRTIYYVAYGRIATSNKSPVFTCSTNNLYTATTSNKGNKSLSSPIGLITADEVAFAGGVWATNNTSYYLYTGSSYWTMSPYYFSDAGFANMVYVYLNGNLTNYSVNNVPGVRPVINLKADTLFTGSGTISDPFIPV